MIFFLSFFFYKIEGQKKKGAEELLCGGGIS
jgi:hypothetical protein